MVTVDPALLLTTILGGILSLGIIELFGRLAGGATRDKEMKVLNGLVFLGLFFIYPIIYVYSLLKIKKL